MKYKCKECGQVAEIDFQKKTVSVQTAEENYPLHPGCVLANPVDTMDRSKLEPV